MAPLLIGALAGGGLGLLKGLTVDRDKENRQRTLAAATQRYSPWTGLRAGPIEEADPFGKMLGGAGAGASFGQNYENAQAAKALQDQNLSSSIGMDSPEYISRDNAIGMEDEARGLPSQARLRMQNRMQDNPYLRYRQY